MKTLYININNEEVQSNDELEVLPYDLDSDFFFYLGEKIAKGCKVENENALITDFNTQDTAEDYQKIIAQWNEIKVILFSEEFEGEFEFTLPDGYIHWLRYSEKYNHVYDKNFSHGESTPISIDLEELYEESTKSMQCEILFALKRNDLYLEIDEIVFNDDAVTRKSPIVRAIKGEYEGVVFKAYEKREQGGISITNGGDNFNDDLTMLVNWICDEFEKEKAVNWRCDEKMMSKIYGIMKNALNEYETSKLNRSVDIWIPYVAKYDSNGTPIHTTNFRRTLSKGLLYSLKYPDEVEDKSWGWEIVRYLDGGLFLKKHNDKYGLVDFEGIIIAQCEYNEIIQFRSGNIKLLKDGKYGLINKEKTINIPCIYDDIMDFSEHGIAKVRKDGVWNKIDKTGAVLCIDDNDLFPIYGVFLGKTLTILDLECEIDIKEMDNYKLYSFTLKKDPNITFYKIDDAPISSMQIRSESTQYVAILRKIEKTFVSNKPFNGICNLILYNKSQLRAFNIINEVIVLEYNIDKKFSLIDKFLDHVSKCYENSL